MFRYVPNSLFVARVLTVAGPLICYFTLLFQGQTQAHTIGALIAIGAVLGLVCCTLHHKMEHNFEIETVILMFFFGGFVLACLHATGNPGIQATAYMLRGTNSLYVVYALCVVINKQKHLQQS